MLAISPYHLAARYLGVEELPGASDHPLIQWWLSLCNLPLASHDEVPWCSAFVNGIAWELGLMRSKSALARSWLTIGAECRADAARADDTIVVLARGPAPFGHVGFFSSVGPNLVYVLGGNQANRVSVFPFPATAVLGYRTLVVEEG